MRPFVLSVLVLASACMFQRGNVPRATPSVVTAHFQPSWEERQPVGPVFWVVDGKVLGPDSSNAIARRIQQLDKSDILSVQVLKGKAALDRYGIDASGGAVIVTTRAGVGVGAQRAVKDAERP